MRIFFFAAMMIPPKVVLRARPSGRSRYAARSKAARADPKGAHSNSPGPPAPVRFYARGLQGRPFAPNFNAQRWSLNDNEHASVIASQTKPFVLYALCQRLRSPHPSLALETVS